MKLTARDIAYVGVGAATLIAAQYALSAVPGVEVVTVLLLCFSFYFGAVRGMLVATCFSLVCGFLHGFDVKSFLLYLIYYNVFSLVFGLLGKGKKTPLSLCVGGNIGLCLLLFLSLSVRFFVLPHVSRTLTAGLSGVSWGLTGCAVAGLVLLNGATILGAAANGENSQRRKAVCFAVAQTAMVTALAAVGTVCFTLLDDVLYPLFYGGWGQQAVAYFYSAFPVMIPQTVCTVVSVGLLFTPIQKIFHKTIKIN